MLSQDLRETDRWDGFCLGGRPTKPTGIKFQTIIEPSELIVLSFCPGSCWAFFAACLLNVTEQTPRQPAHYPCAQSRGALIQFSIYGPQEWFPQVSASPQQSRRGSVAEREAGILPFHLWRPQRKSWLRLLKKVSLMGSNPHPQGEAASLSSRASRDVLHTTHSPCSCVGSPYWGSAPRGPWLNW